MWITAQRFLRIRKTQRAAQQGIMPFKLQCEKTTVEKDTGARRLTAAPLAIATTCKQPWCLSIDERTEKMHYNRYKGMFLSLYKKRINATCSTTDGSRDCLREKSQREKAKYPGTPLLSAIWERMLAMNSLSKHYRLTELQNALVLARGNAGEKRQLWSWEWASPHSYNWVTSKALVYSKGNSVLR